MPASSDFDTLRRPRMRIVANGVALTGAIEASVTSTSYYGADSFSVSLATGSDLLSSASYWSSPGKNEIAVQFSVDGGWNFITAIEGLADRVMIDPIRGTVYLEGRDLTSQLVDTVLSEQYLNRTASEIALILAENHGLVPCITATSRLVGRYYQDDRSRTALTRDTACTTEWDLLVQLARYEDFEVFVQGHSLFFQPRVAVPIVLTEVNPASLCALRMEYLPSMSDVLEVRVQSWNSERQMAVTGRMTSGASPVSGAAPGGNAGQRNYVITRPNLTAEDAELMAAQVLREIQVHRRCISLEMPGDTGLVPRVGLRLSGTGTAFDQVYLVESVERRFSPSHGFTQHIRAVDL